MIDMLFTVLGWITTGFVLGVVVVRWVDLEYGSRFEKRRARLTWPLSLGWDPTKANVEAELAEYARTMVPVGVLADVRVVREEPGRVTLETKISGRPSWRFWS